ncbi:hypothetical protein DCC81_13170 [Chitinophaga parva]|uniref:Uncharacterized protein n=1 Tax=Chitinophaga parva TaxID=2169414 RepID=A0A2T7BG33_9BACT|nr:hypothetical protein DCC81_13170 [Chitinophaga parva]
MLIKNGKSLYRVPSSRHTKSGFKRMVRGGMGEKSMPKQYSLELIYYHQWPSNKNAAPVDAAFHVMCL